MRKAEFDGLFERINSELLPQTAEESIEIVSKYADEGDKIECGLKL